MKKWKCTVCGYIHVGEEPPEECPVCGADSSKFEELIEAVPVEQETGIAAGEVAGMSGKLVEFMLKNHFHPIAVHTPNGIVPAAVLFLVLAVVMNVDGLEPAAFYNMIFVLLAMPVVLFSGFIEWQKHYNGSRTAVFMTKIICGIIVLVTVAVLVIWRMTNPEVAGPESPVRWAYFLLHLVALGAVGLAGNLGGKLVFGRKR